MRSNVPVFAAIVVLLALGWWVWQRAENDAKKTLANTAQLAAYLNRAQTTKLTIRVFKTKEGACASDTDAKGHAKKGDTFEWTVKTPGYGDGESCFKAGEKVQLFAKTSGTSPLDLPEPYGYPTITATAKKSTISYMYEVWLVDRGGKKLVMMEDPELEIVETVKLEQ